MGASSARAAVTGDLVLALRFWHSEEDRTTLRAETRLIADADLRKALRFHLDVDQEGTATTELYDAYGEWHLGIHRLRWGQFLVPFGIYNRSEQYYVGLISDPLIRDYPADGPRLNDSEKGLDYLGAWGPWQVEGALFGARAPGIIPSGGEGSVRLQWFHGPLIVGVNALRDHGRHPLTARRGEARFFGLDLRFSRPTLILRGELVSGRVPGGSPRGFYVDVLYHPMSLHRVTFVGRTEAVEGQPGDGRYFSRQTVGLKWDVGNAWAVALNQSFGPSRPRLGARGTLLYVWYTRRL